MSLKGRILLVDDDPAGRYAMARYLRQGGYTVTEAGTGTEGLQLARAERPDLILLDIRLPDIDGFEVCRRLRADPSTSPTPVIHVSASFTSTADRVSGLEGGADAYLTEPVAPEELLAQVGALMRVRKAELALRDSEERFRVMTEAVPGFLFTCGPDGQWEFANLRVSEYSGLKLSQLAGDGWMKMLHPEEAESVRADWEAGLRSKDCFERELRLRHKSGEYRWFTTKCCPMLDGAGNVLKWFGSSMDIHDLKTAQEEIEAFNAELERRVEERTLKLRDAVGELEHFSYTITHDLRAPLRAMTGFGQILIEDALHQLSPENQDHLQRIIAAAKRMDTLITDALSYSRAVRQQLVLKPLDTHALLKGMIESYPAFQPPRAEVTIEGELPPVMGNEAGLTQCFSNFLDNAVKFVPPGGKPCVRIWAEARPPMVRLWFADDGIGIPEESLSRVFDMFMRVSSKYEGTGIGLALVRKIADRMGGAVGVESAVGKGSRFWLELKAAATTPHSPSPTRSVPASADTVQQTDAR